MPSVSDLLERIVALERANKEKDAELTLLGARVEKLETAIELKDNTIKLLKEHIGHVQAKSNRTELYTMRSNLRIHGIAAPKDNETNNDVLSMVKSIGEDLGVKIEPNDIYRAHRVGKIYPEKKKDGTLTGKKIQSVIVRFRSWEKRCELYRARPRKGSEKVKKNRKKDKATPAYQTVSLDLSKASRDLLSCANSKIKEKFPDQDDGHCYAFADINCNLRIKLPSTEKKFVNFTNEDELDMVLADF